MVKHVLKNGTKLTDITGYIVKRTECQRIYEILERTAHEITTNHTLIEHDNRTNRALRSVASGTEG